MELTSWLDITGGRFVTGLLIFARFGGLLFATPLIGGRSVPNPVRVGLGVALAMILTPLFPPSGINSLPLLAAGLVKETVLGLVLGWAASLVFAAVQIAGEWLDTHGGFHMAQLLNPAFEVQSGLIGTFQHLLGGLVFFAVGGHAILLRAAAHSLTISPPGVLKLDLGGPDDWASLLVKIIWVAIQLVAPVAGALFLAEIALAVANRALPQVNVMILALPAKALLTLAVLALALPAVVQVMHALFTGMAEDLLRLMQPGTGR